MRGRATESIHDSGMAARGQMHRRAILHNASALVNVEIGKERGGHAPWWMRQGAAIETLPVSQARP
jgi:hypothetical protein